MSDGPSFLRLPETIDAETLRQWMDRRVDVTVLDVRPLKDRADWSIPGSIHVDAYDALWARDPHALDSVNLPEEKPVVTVCAAGRTSLIASSLLRGRGFNACSLAGGMKAWSSAWNTAEVPISRPGVRVVQIRRTGKGCLSYMVGIEGEAAVIDASVHPEVYLEIARNNGWRIVSLIETHVHADHLSRSHALRAATGARLFVPAQKRMSCPHFPVHDEDELALGPRGTLFQAIHSPGHTGESTCYLMDGVALFTGDTLFLKGVGRPDLEDGPAEASSRARILYRSLSRIRALPGDTIILPSHTSAPVPFDRVPLFATLAQVESENPILAEDEESFVSRILDRMPPTPPNFLRIMHQNEACAEPEGDPAELESGANRCSVG